MFQTSNFDYPDAAAADRAAAGEGYLYSRHGNPTCHAFEAAVADLEGGDGAVAYASGMAAMTGALLSCVEAGGEALVSDGLYGGSTELVRDIGPRLGVTVRFVAGWDTAAVQAAMTPRTRALIVETVTNPLLRVADLPGLGALARERGIALIVDSTFASPVLCRPLSHGATIVVHSASKYLSGHGDVIAGIAIARSDRLPLLQRMRTLLGASLDPFAAWLAVRGLRTLAIRVERQCATAARLAEALAGMRGVAKVHFPGRTDHPDHARCLSLLEAAGAIVSFELANGAAARRCYDRLQLVARAASLGEVSSLMTHPASFSHKGLPPAERARQGIGDGLLRLSVGIEDPADLETDLRQAIEGS